MCKANQYYQAITVLDGQDRLIDMKVADFPNLKSDQKKKMHREMHKLANPKHLQKTMSFEDFIGKMNGRRNS